MGRDGKERTEEKEVRVGDRKVKMKTRELEKGTERGNGNTEKERKKGKRKEGCKMGGGGETEGKREGWRSSLNSVFPTLKSRLHCLFPSLAQTHTGTTDTHTTHMLNHLHTQV